jgi:2-phospho-L-lactate guanylyltransferase
VWLTIPVKPLNDGKSRLGVILCPAQRAALAEFLLLRTMVVGARVFPLERIVVVSSDERVEQLARAQGVSFVVDTSPNDLNYALALAARHIESRGATGQLVLPIDLPFVTADEIRKLLSSVPAGPACVSAPDRERRGTNALLLAPCDVSLFHFGTDSYGRHVQACRDRDRLVRTVRRAGLAFDLDMPHHCRLLKERQGVPLPWEA